jgi:hypothetical protein
MGARGGGRLRPGGCRRGASRDGESRSPDLGATEVPALHLGDTRSSATRISRIERVGAGILVGGATERQALPSSPAAAAPVAPGIGMVKVSVKLV